MERISDLLGRKNYRYIVTMSYFASFPVDRQNRFFFATKVTPKQLDGLKKMAGNWDYRRPVLYLSEGVKLVVFAGILEVAVYAKDRTLVFYIRAE